MMMIPSYFFKARARGALKGNWQTALLVSFFASIFSTVLQVLLNQTLPVVETYAQLLAAVEAIPRWRVLAIGVTLLLMLLVTPMLAQGCNAYFLARLRGKELGFKGLFSRARYWGKALWLFLLISVRVFLWSLLLLVPGVIAAFRYMLAPYYLAENPDLSATECIEKSKQAMKGAKLSLFSLLLSFIGWQLLSNILQLYLLDVNAIVSIIIGLGISLFVATYTNAAVAAFYLTLTDDRLRERQSMTPEQLMRALAAISGGQGMPGPFGMPGRVFPGPTGSEEPDDEPDPGEDDPEEEPKDSSDDENE